MAEATAYQTEVLLDEAADRIMQLIEDYVTEESIERYDAGANS